jgi:transposase-like protein
MDLPFTTLPPPRLHSVDAGFVPPYCPRITCPSGGTSAATANAPPAPPPFVYQRKGAYVRSIDLRVVQRYRCLVCRASFSSQSFRLDYRLRKPWLPLAVFQALVAKTTLRQTSRSLGCKLDTVAHHLKLVGNHGAWMHRRFLERASARGGGLSGTFQLDELETFEQNRRVCPLTVPVLVHKKTWFVVHTDVGSLPSRGNLGPFQDLKKQRYEQQFGKRTNRSKEVVTACAEALKRHLAPDQAFFLETDQKKSYPPIFRAVFGRAYSHCWISSKEKRDRKCLLFTVNNTLAQARDNLSRLVRRNWGYSKKESRLRFHLWAWILYRNYVRELTCRVRTLSSASALGVTTRRLSARECLQWRHELPIAS